MHTIELLLRNFAILKYQPTRHVNDFSVECSVAFQKAACPQGAPVIISVVLNKARVNSQDLFRLQQILMSISTPAYFLLFFPKVLRILR